MTVKSLLNIALLAIPLASPVYADTNLAGDEIIILNESPVDNGVGISSGNATDPVLNYLPNPPAQPNYSTKDSTSILVSEDLWQRIKDGYAMPDLDSAYTANHESWYAARPDYVRRMVDRSQKYLFHIVEEVQKRGMPTEIALLPMVESAFNPQAYSTSRASGIWQFVPATGKDFGLKQNWWVDSRRDVTAATNAALTYLQRLHVMFGSWDLALAAYNAGEGTVRRAIERNRAQGLPTDYQSLQLPPETRNYVPKLQAIKNIMTHPEDYGLRIQAIANRPYFTKVTAPEQIDSHLAAKLAEVTFEEFVSLNPEYNRPVITANGSVHEILLPVGAADKFKTNLAAYDKPLVSWQTYHAKRGERMENIARKFGIGLAQLRDVNDLPSKKMLSNAQPILVPSANLSDTPIVMDDHTFTDQSVATSNKQNTKQHTVKSNETLAAIAKRYGVTPKQLMAANQLKNAKLKADQILNISPSTQIAKQQTPAKTKLAKKTTNKKIQYVVKRGDTLDSIAKKFDVARDDLQRWNKISGSHIAPGLKLTVITSDEA
ncbi:lytic transglycosylase [Methylovorus sp. MM2]|uniref:LysM peptidoglycan-binding domain-containing protein n=1 Tax=Methylovorus sp. MM2 TaxID=1848038 RepID=UPI0007E0C465|nr:LysM peptidoglycan-binding domain-containing protein [Methylovorus sp. MM2]OAM52951.1 lytic transglycosylase [Methylovorus sp. MM2]